MERISTIPDLENDVLFPDKKTSRILRLKEDGSRDSTFGSNGAVDIFCPEELCQVNALHFDLQGRIVAVGHVLVATVGAVPIVVRLLADGSPDTSFGDNGRVMVPFEEGSGNPSGVRVDGGQRIVVSLSVAADDDKNFCVFRLREDGALDPTFGVGGKVRISHVVGPSNPLGGLALDEEGIVAVGYAVGPVRTSFAAARWRSDGSLDSSFGGSGRIRASFIEGDAFATGITIDAEHRVTAGGFAGAHAAPPHDQHFAAVRWLRDGARDPSFSQDGKLRVKFPSGKNSFAWAIAGRQGRVVLAGDAGDAEAFGLVRLRQNGQVDEDFGQNGFVVDPVINNKVNIARAVVIDGQNRVLAAGRADTFAAVVRYKSNGDRDPTFGGDGRVIILGSNDEQVLAMVRDPQGRILLATRVRFS